MRNILDLGYVHMTLAVETDVKPNYRYQLVELIAVVLLPRRGVLPVYMTTCFHQRRIYVIIKNVNIACQARASCGLALCQKRWECNADELYEYDVRL